MYAALRSIFRIYWQEYGGFRELIASPFLHFAALATVFYGFGALEFSWREFVLSSLPTILGFSLAAYAITFSLMGSALHRALSIAVDQRRGIPLINIVNSTFFHVLLFQVLALVYAVLSQGSLAANSLAMLPLTDEAKVAGVQSVAGFTDIFGFFLTTYSLMLLMSVGIAMFRLGRLSPDRQVAQDGRPANDDPAPAAELPDVTRTIRFRLVSGLARLLGLYNRPPS